MSGANEKRRPTMITDYSLGERVKKKIPELGRGKNLKNVLKNLSLWCGFY